MINIRFKGGAGRVAKFFSTRTSTALFALLTLLAFGLSNALSTNAAEPVESPDEEAQPKLFALSVVDYRGFKDEGLECAKRDLDAVKFFFRRYTLHNLLNYNEVDPEAATPEAILKAIDDLEGKVGPNDVVWFYFSGRDAYDGETGGRFFRLKDAEGNDKPLYRREVKDRLSRLGARLVVLFTDCPDVFASPISGGIFKPYIVVTYRPIFQKLLVDPETRGFVDLTSSLPGQSAFAYQDCSLATSVAVKVFDDLDEELENDPNAEVDWRRFFEIWRDRTEEASEEISRSLNPDDPAKLEKQTPHVYELPGTPRLGARAVARNEANGVEITEILKGFPAERAGLKVGDVILRIGSEATNTEDEYNRLVDAAPRLTKITFVRPEENVGEEREIDVELNGTPKIEPPPEQPANAEQPAPPEPEQTDDGVSNPSGEEHKPFAGIALNDDGTIAGVAPNSPAQDAGLEVGDVVGAFDGKPIYEVKDFDDALEAAQDVAKLEIKKKNGEQTVVTLNGLRVKPIERQTAPPDDRRAKPFIGIAFYSDAPSAAPKARGVKPGSPAEIAGIRAGDVVRRLNGKSIAAVKDFDDALATVSDEAEIVVLRAGVKKTLQLVGLLSASRDDSSDNPNDDPNDKPNVNSNDKPAFGVELRKATQNQIRRVVPGSPAEEAGLKAGDTLLSFNGETIQTTDDFDKAVDEAVAAKKRNVVVEIESNGTKRTVDVELNVPN